MQKGLLGHSCLTYAVCFWRYSRLTALSPTTEPSNPLILLSKMPLRQTNLNGSKRKPSPPPESPRKRRQNEETGFKDSRTEEEYSIVDRQFYPPEMTNERCAQYNANKLERPMDTLNKAQEATKDARDAIDVNHAVVHWFKCDLRTYDNTSLHLASKLAKSMECHLSACTSSHHKTTRLT